MMIRSSKHHMHHRARLQDEGQLVILTLWSSRRWRAWRRSPASSSWSRTCTDWPRACTLHWRASPCFRRGASSRSCSRCTMRTTTTRHLSGPSRGPAVSRRREPRLRRLLLLRGRHRHVGADGGCVVRLQADAAHRLAALHPRLPFQHHRAGAADQHRSERVLSASTTWSTPLAASATANVARPVGRRICRRAASSSSTNQRDAARASQSNIAWPVCSRLARYMALSACISIAALVLPQAGHIAMPMLGRTLRLILRIWIGAAMASNTLRARRTRWRASIRR